MRIIEKFSAGITTLELDYGPMKLRVSLSGIPRTVQRQWLLLIHQALVQLLNEFKLRRSSLDAFSVFSQMDRQVSLHQAFKVDPKLKRNRYGFRIRLIRLHLKMTQKDMAKLLGTPRSHLSAVEHGKIYIRRETMAKWENILRYYLKTDLQVPEVDPPLIFQADKSQTFLQGVILRTGEVELRKDGRRVSLEEQALRMSEQSSSVEMPTNQ